MESYHTEHIERSHSRTRSHVSYDQETWKLQQEIDHMRRKLRHREGYRRSPSFPPSDGSRGSKDHSYRCRSRTPSSESYSASLSQDRLEKSSNKREKKSSHHGIGNDAMSKTLQKISKSPFVRRINKAKIFPSSLGPVAMHWFDALEEGLVGSFKELTRAFGARFITCSRVPKPIDSLLSMAMREEQTLMTYSDIYWETYNEINGDFKDVGMRTFKVGLPAEHELRKSLTMKFALNMCQLMDRTDKAKVFPEKRDPQGGGYQGNRPQMKFSNQMSTAGAQLVNLLFKEPVYQILEKIMNEPYFKWPNKMDGDSSRRNQSLYRHYHQDRGYTMEDCRTLRDHLSQLVKERKLNRFVH